jgi:DNA-binding NarL/FixJ family response regulator
MTEARVLIVEDEVIVAEALRRTLENSGYDVIGHAIDGREAVQMARRLHPDVILMDVVLVGPNDGIEAAQSIQRTIDTSIIYVTGQANDSVVNAAARSGACGYIVKPFQAQQLTSSIEIALHRRHDARALSDQTFLRGRPKTPAAIQALCVTEREKEVIRGLICYRRLYKVADALGISVHTARNHLKSIFRKLNVHSQDELLELVSDDPLSRID